MSRWRISSENWNVSIILNNIDNSTTEETMSNKNSIHGFNSIMDETEERIILLEAGSVEKKIRLKHRMKEKRQSHEYGEKFWNL